MVNKTILENGLTIVSEQIDYVRSVSIGVFIKNGSAHENEDVLGISHFVEHLLFKGTKNRTAKDIAFEIDAVGGYLNAYTTKEYTCYYAKMLDKNLKLAIDILSDMILNPKLDDSDIDMERNVVYEEIAMNEDSPEDIVHDIILEAAFGAKSGVGAATLGTYESLKRINSEVMRNYIQKMYTPQNTVISITGNIEANAINLISEKFGNWEKDGGSNEFPIPIYKPETIFRNKDIEQTHFCLGFPAFGGDDDRNYDLLTFNNIFGSGMSSNLFQKVREEKGLVYSIFSYISTFVSSGLFIVSASMHPKNLDEVLKIVFDEIESMKKKDFSFKRFNQAKEQLKGNYILGLENVSSRMQSLGRSYLLYDKFRTPDEVLQKIDDVKFENTTDVINHIFNRENMCVSAIGKTNGLSENMFFDN